jgi:hypothetical protein
MPGNCGLLVVRDGKLRVDEERLGRGGWLEEDRLGRLEGVFDCDGGFVVLEPLSVGLGFLVVELAAWVVVFESSLVVSLFWSFWLLLLLLLFPLLLLLEVVVAAALLLPPARWLEARPRSEAKNATVTPRCRTVPRWDVCARRIMLCRCVPRNKGKGGFHQLCAPGRGGD